MLVQKAICHLSEGLGPVLIFFAFALDLDTRVNPGIDLHQPSARDLAGHRQLHRANLGDRPSGRIVTAGVARGQSEGLSPSIVHPNTEAGNDGVRHIIALA